ncbi:MAG: hypothetical protein R2815_02240 [Flavobacteriales bacterium]
MSKAACLVENLSALRIFAALLVANALFHLFRDLEWVPDEEGWGALAILSMMFWAGIALVVDLLMHLVMKDRGLLNMVQALVILALFLFLDW